MVTLNLNSIHQLITSFSMAPAEIDFPCIANAHRRPLPKDEVFEVDAAEMRLASFKATSKAEAWEIGEVRSLVYI